MKNFFPFLVIFCSKLHETIQRIVTYYNKHNKIITKRHVFNARQNIVLVFKVNHWRIRGGGRDACPLGYKFLHFHAVFAKAQAKIIGLYPNLSGW